MKHLDDFGKFVNESSETEEKLTRGEKAALAQDKDLLTDAQAAVCYLYAKDQSHKIYAKGGKGAVISDAIGTAQKNDVADSIGLKAQSFSRAVKKMRILLGKDEQGEEALYPKLEKLFAHFEDMTTNQVADLAKSAFTEDAKIKGEGYRKQRLDKQAAEKKRDAKLVQDVRDVYKGLYTYFVNGKKLSPAEAKAKAVDQVQKKFDISAKEILEITGNK
jgi:hypothetical protein